MKSPTLLLVSLVALLPSLALASQAQNSAAPGVNQVTLPANASGDTLTFEILPVTTEGVALGSHTPQNTYDFGCKSPIVFVNGQTAASGDLVGQFKSLTPITVKAPDSGRSLLISVELLGIGENCQGTFTFQDQYGDQTTIDLSHVLSTDDDSFMKDPDEIVHAGFLEVVVTSAWNASQ